MEHDAPRWRDLGTPGEIAAAVIDLYRRRGSAHYDEVVTQTDHARQCAALAIAADAPSPTVVAAFLHDIGHLLLGDETTERDLRHEDVGARFIANWFDEEVTEPIRLHVAAKRYLCAISPPYRDGLSAASVHSLELQGGPMSDDEVAAFERTATADTAVALRRWDDQAKVPDARTPDLPRLEEILAEVLSR